MDKYILELNIYELEFLRIELKAINCSGERKQTILELLDRLYKARYATGPNKTLLEYKS